VDERVRQFLRQHQQAAMVTQRADGTPHVVMVGVALVETDGGPKLWSSGTLDRVRTRHLRRNPRSTLFVYDTSARHRWLSLETSVTILDGPDVPEMHLRLFEQMQWGRARFGDGQAPEELLETMRAERRVIYEFEIQQAYGMY
jgi:PPOX class probable F420-dependent enzyme